LPTQPAMAIQPARHPGEGKHTHLHSLLLCLLLIWIE
jgi:hypothetical protein